MDLNVLLCYWAFILRVGGMAIPYLSQALVTRCLGHIESNFIVFCYHLNCNEKITQSDDKIHIQENIWIFKYRAAYIFYRFKI